MDTTSHTTSLFLGIDGGGSTCRARLADAHGTVLGEGRAGPANFRLGVAQVSVQIEAAAQAALAQAGLAGHPLNTLQAGLGLAGLVMESDYELARPLAALFAHCELSSDAYIACLGAHRGQPGAIIILGTGSCAQIISPEVSRTYGGWGFDIADQASGAWLGHTAVRIALLALESIVPHSPLTQAIGGHFGQQATSFLDWSLTATAADYGQFAPLVFEHADQQDKHALPIVREACEHIARLVTVLDSHGTGRISLLGGLASVYPRYLPDALSQKLSPPAGDALDGALILAQKQLSTVSKL